MRSWLDLRDFLPGLRTTVWRSDKREVGGSSPPRPIFPATSSGPTPATCNIAVDGHSTEPMLSRRQPRVLRRGNRLVGRLSLGAAWSPRGAVRRSPSRAASANRRSTPSTVGRSWAAARGQNPPGIRPAMHPGWGAAPTGSRCKDNITLRQVQYTSHLSKAPLCVAPRANSPAIPLIVAPSQPGVGRVIHGLPGRPSATPKWRVPPARISESSQESTSCVCSAVIPEPMPPSPTPRTDR